MDKSNTNVQTSLNILHCCLSGFWSSGFFGWISGDILETKALGSDTSPTLKYLYLSRAGFIREVSLSVCDILSILILMDMRERRREGKKNSAKWNFCLEEGQTHQESSRELLLLAILSSLRLSQKTNDGPPTQCG